METGAASTFTSPSAVYERVVRDARKSFGPEIGDDAAELAARNAVDELLVHQSARVTTFVPVLAMRKIRESIALSNRSGD